MSLDFFLLLGGEYKAQRMIVKLGAHSDLGLTVAYVTSRLSGLGTFIYFIKNCSSSHVMALPPPLLPGRGVEI